VRNDFKDGVISGSDEANKNQIAKTVTAAKSSALAARQSVMGNKKKPSKYSEKFPARWTPFVLEAGTQGLFRNNIYNVRIEKLPDFQIGDELIRMVCLSITRIDFEACHDWRHFQRIKNEVCGPETTAIEVYPPESVLVDTANQYFLYVYYSTKVFPFISQKRAVSEASFEDSKQRPFPADARPPDLLTEEDLRQRVGNVRGF